jgi:hypothetical protein
VKEEQFEGMDINTGNARSDGMKGTNQTRNKGIRQEMNSRRQTLIRSNISERGEATKLKLMCWAGLGYKGTGKQHGTEGRMRNEGGKCAEEVRARKGR